MPSQAQVFQLRRDRGRLGLDPRQVPLPVHQTPDLQATTHPDDHRLTLDLGVLAQVRWNRHPPLPVELYIFRTGQHEAHEVAPADRQPSQFLLVPRPLRRRVHCHALIEPPRDDHPAAEGGAECLGQYEPPLVVQGVTMFASEQAPHHSPLRSTIIPPVPSNSFTQTRVSKEFEEITSRAKTPTSGVSGKRNYQMWGARLTREPA